MAKLTRKKGYKRRRSFSEKVWIVMSILIAVAMVVTTFASVFISG